MQHYIGLALVILQAALLGLLSQTWLFPLAVVLAAAVGVFTKLRIPLTREQAFFLSSIAAFVFLLKHRLSPHEFPTGTEFIRTQVAFIIAQYLLAIEAAHFLIRHEDDELSPVLPALGAVALICIADVQITDEQRTMTRLFAVGYPLCWALYLWSCRRPLPMPDSADDARRSARKKALHLRRLAAGVVLVSIAVLGWFSSLALYEFEKKIEGWLVRTVAARDVSSRVGFSRSSQLGSVARRKSRDEDKVVLLIDSRTDPGYLRAAVFSKLEYAEWQSPSSMQGMQITLNAEHPQGMRPLAESEKLYAHPMMDEKTTSRWQYLECWLQDDEDSAAFTPLGTTHLITPSEQVGVLPFGVFLLYNIAEGDPYVACVPEDYTTYAMSEVNRARWLNVPEEYRPILKELAKEVFEGKTTAREKIAAAEAYFHREFQYDLGIEIPAGENPILYFLNEKPPAHCEYFASAATLLLRTAGVPSRYVTGVVAGEWNPSGGYWVARNRDAHAWVEAYDDSAQDWVTVEATPAQGVPLAERRSGRFASWEILKIDWKRFRAFLAQGRLDRAWQVLKSSWLVVPFGLFAVAFVAYLVWRFPRGWRKARSAPEILDPELLEMRKLLIQMDGRLEAWGWSRGAGETLHQFAGRLEAWAIQEPSRALDPNDRSKPDAQEADWAAAWYLAYAGSLYKGQWDPETRRELAANMPAGSQR